MLLQRIVVPEEGYLAEVHDLCKKHNVLLICDEIQTACRAFVSSLSHTNKLCGHHRACAEQARCSHQITIISNQTWFFSARLCRVEVSAQPTPSVMLFRCSLVPVYPVSAVLADKDVMLCIQPGEHGSTYGGYVVLSSVLLFDQPHFLLATPLAVRLP